MISNAIAVRVSAMVGLLGVALGAFGAHGLSKLLERNGTAEIWQKAVLYHLVHAVVLFVLAQRRPLQAGPWWSFLIGVLIFSGTLYLLAATNTRWLGAITPIGGLSFIAGWFWLVLRPGANPPGV